MRSASKLPHGDDRVEKTAANTTATNTAATTTNATTLLRLRPTTSTEKARNAQDPTRFAISLWHQLGGQQRPCKKATGSSDGAFETFRNL